MDSIFQLPIPQPKKGCCEIYEMALSQSKNLSLLDAAVKLIDFISFKTGLFFCEIKKVTKKNDRPITGMVKRNLNFLKYSVMVKKHKSTNENDTNTDLAFNKKREQRIRKVKGREKYKIDFLFEVKKT